MRKVIHRADERGRSEHDWLASRYSFSFADWHDSERMGFGALRVLNDDVINPLSGFPMHGHRDMEIITIVTRGAVTHTDNLGNNSTVSAGEVQVMSAGTGVVHSEENASSVEPLALFQLWIKPRSMGAAPRYAQKSFPREAPGLTLLVSPDGAGGLPINQDAWIYHAQVDAAHPLRYPLTALQHLTDLTAPMHGLYVFVIEGELSIAGETLGPRDAIGIWEIEQVDLASATLVTALLIEVPMR